MRPDYCPIGGEPCQSVCAEPCSVGKQATPHETLIAQLMDSRAPKTEREHAAAREIDRLREAGKFYAALAEPIEPVAWRTFDGEGGYDYRTYEGNEDYAAEWAKRNPRQVGWVEPLYTAPSARRMYERS